MTKRWSWIAGIALAGALSASASAQSTFSDPFAPAAGSVAEHADDAKPASDATQKTAPKPKKARAAKPRKSDAAVVTVVITNKRTVGLVELTAAIAGTSDAKKIAGPLAEGRKTVAHLKHDKSCLFDLKGSYADGADIDMPGIELCKDKTINLTDD